MPGHTVTLMELAVAAAKRADMLKLDASGDYAFTDQVDQSALGFYLNSEMAALWDALINANEDYCVRHKTINVKADQEEYPMPPDFLKLRKVFPICSGKRCAALRRFHLKDLGQADSLSAVMTGSIEESRYQLIGNRVFLHPTPTSAAELELWYIPRFDPITRVHDAINFAFPAGWEDYVSEAAAARLLEDEESDSSAHRARAKEILQRIMILAEDRDVGEPHNMQDTEGYL